MRNDRELPLHPSRSMHLLLLLVSIGLTLVGVWLGLEGRWPGYLCAALFGLGIPIVTLQLVPGSSFLRIGEYGFEYAAMCRRHFVRGKDIKEFGILTQRYLGLPVGKMVGWNYVPDSGESSTGRPISKGIAGMEAGLADTYGLKADELMAIMVEYWTRYRVTELRNPPDKE